MFSIKKDNRSKGFSIMEIIIAVGIVAFAFVGIMSVFASNIRSEIVSRDKITASYLAQEGIEIIRHKRDSNWFVGGAATWNNGINDVDHQALSLKDSNDPTKGWDLAQAGYSEADKSKQRVYLANGVYVQHKSGIPGGWQATKFRRLIDIDVNGDQMKITATVYYSEDGNSKVQIVSYLYNNWYTN